MIKQDNILRFENLSKFDNLIHGFSTSFFGSMRPSDPGYQTSLTNFANALNIDSQKIVRMHQVHGNYVYNATEKDYGKKRENTDGLITKEKQVFLGVITGDCIPLLFYDPKLQIVAAVHAGWRGLFAEIIKEAISNFIKIDSKPEDIIVGLGPSIKSCCYSISEELMENFKKKFDNIDACFIRRDGKIFFDLQLLAKDQLLALGILNKNIEDANYCTFDNKDIFSYRREGENFGEMIGIIGVR